MKSTQGRLTLLAMIDRFYKKELIMGNVGKEKVTITSQGVLKFKKR